MSHVCLPRKALDRIQIQKNTQRESGSLGVDKGQEGKKEKKDMYTCTHKHKLIWVSCCVLFFFSTSTSWATPFGQLGLNFFFLIFAVSLAEYNTLCFVCVTREKWKQKKKKAVYGAGDCWPSWMLGRECIESWKSQHYIEKKAKSRNTSSSSLSSCFYEANHMHDV